MCFIRLFVWCLLIVTIIKGEIITFLKNKHVICVATESDINSTIYVHPPTDLEYTEQFKCSRIDSERISCSKFSKNDPKEKFNVLSFLARPGSDWNTVSKNMGRVIDERWEGFKIQKSAFNLTDLKEDKYSISIYNEINTSDLNVSENSETCNKWSHNDLKNGNTNRGKIPLTPPLWKLHKLEFIEASRKSKTEDSIVIYHTGLLYVSMFVYLGHNSTLNITLKSNEKIISKSIRRKEKWRKVWFEIESVDQTTFSIRRELQNPTSMGYWAIDEIKFHTRPIRISREKLPENVSPHICKLLHDSSGPNTTKKHCNFGAFGSECNLTCKDFFQDDSYCDNYVICTMDDNHWSLENRKLILDKTNRSQNKCEIKCNQCDSKIKRCKTHFPNGLPVLLEKPSLENISDYSITISVQNLKYYPAYLRPELYIVQYKEINGPIFKNHIPYYKDILGKTIVIGNLKTKQFQYKVRILLLVQNQTSEEDIPELTTYKRSLKTFNKTSDGFTLQWSPIKDDNFSLYTLNYTCQQAFCKKTQRLTKTENTNFFSKFDLKPLTDCSVKLYVLEDTQLHMLDTIEVTTPETINIEKNELPDHVTLLNNSISIYFKKCKGFQGPINYTVTCRCVSPWCMDQFENFDHIMTTYSSTLTKEIKLLPFTDYQLEVSATRGNNAKNKTFKPPKTPAGRPGKVRKFSIYCSNDTTLFVKWLPPYPPSGSVSHYILQSQINETVNDDHRCGHNQEFICASVANSANISVFTKNTNFDQLGSPETISSFSKLNAQKQLENFTLTSVSPNQIKISWMQLNIESLRIATENNPTTHCTKENYNDIVCRYAMKNNETRFMVRIADSACEYTTISIKVSIISCPPEISSSPIIEFCKTKCKLLIPKPNFSNFSLLVTKLDNRNKNWTIKNLMPVDNYLQLEIGEGPEKAVPLQNKSYVMYLQDHDKNTDYPLFIKYETHLSKTKTIALIILLLVFIFTIISLAYLIMAYWLKIYPFELLKKRISPQRLSQSEVTQFTEHYKANKLKTVRSKVDLPKESELAVLIEKEINKEENLTSRITSVPVKLDKFEDYLMNSLADDPYSNDLTRQYRRMQSKIEKPCTVGLLNKHVNKNRYKNLIPYDDTRVVLRDHDCDYINANYIDGYENTNAFIAAQAPQKSTLGDFWWMIWQEKVTYIIMLTELIETGTVKCEQYWPDPQLKTRFGKLLIKNVATKIFADYVDQQLKVECNCETRIIHHLQYKTWPDHGVPLYPQNFTPFMKRLLAMPQKNSPILVHCNAGCGRTGTLIMCDIVLRMAAKEKVLDFVKVLTKMREQRAHLVNNVNQYVFAHFIVLECLFGVDFSIPVNDSFQDEIWKTLRKTTVKPLIEHLDKVMMQFKKRYSCYTSTMNEEDKEKNRFSDILPGHTQIFLPTSSENPSSYINAVIVDCYRCPKKFIVTQQPLPNTVKDFWLMIKEFKINTIVSLNEIDGNNSNCPQFWLWSDNETKLEILEETEEKAYNITKIKITGKTTDKTVNILKMKNWKRETPCPSAPKNLILTWKETFNSSWKGDSQIVVTCYDGATASGLFVALAYLLDKINYEQSCDVFSAIRTVRQSREQFVQEWVRRLDRQPIMSLHIMGSDGIFI